MNFVRSSLVTIVSVLFLISVALPVPAGAGAPPTTIASDTPTPVETATPTETETPVETATPVATETPVETETPVATPTPAETATASETETPASTETPAATASPTPSPSPTESATESPPPVATPTESPTAATATASPTPTALNHFQCYEVHGAFLGRSVTLDDQFGASTVNVRQAKRICNPASKNDENPSAPTDVDHLVGYPINQTSPRFHPIHDVLVVNQFHSLAAPLSVDLVRPDMLLVPSAKSLTAPPPPLAPAIEHFKCYRVKGARFRRSGVTIDDEFGSIVVDIKRPSRLCVPADKNDEGISDTVSHLMCYEVRLAVSSPPFRPAGRVFINNQFEDTVVAAFRPRELCVPSLKNPTAATATPTSTPTPTPTATETPTASPTPAACGLTGRIFSVCGGDCPNAGEQCALWDGLTCSCRVPCHDISTSDVCNGGCEPAFFCGIANAGDLLCSCLED